MADTKTTTTRRLFLAAGSAGAVFGALGAAASAEPGDLPALISAYGKANQAYIPAFEEWERLKKAWKAATSKELRLAPCWADGRSYDLRIFHYEDIRATISEAYARKRQSLEVFRQIGPVEVDQFCRFLDADEAKNLANLDELHAEEERRKESFGLTGAVRRLDDASAALEEAALALCSYRPKTLEEARIKAEAILASAIADDFSDEAKAILRAFSPAADSIG
jgi:hypothetical protein